MNDIEIAMLTGYPSIDYIKHEKENSCKASLGDQQYDDANTLFKTLEEEITND